MEQRILLIDDDEAILDVLQSLLASRSYVADCALDLKQTEANFAAHSYSLVIADLNLQHGETEGIEVLHYVLAQQARPRVIVCSGMGESDLRDKAMRAGADDFITKPFPFKPLIAKIEAQLKESARLQAAHALHPAATPPMWSPASGAQLSSGAQTIRTN